MRLKIKNNVTSIQNRAKSLNYTDLLSRKAINFVGKNLNTCFGLNFKKKQWLIILYPWVSRFVENCYIIFNSKGLSNSYDRNLKNYIPFDMMEFYKIIESESWNKFLSNEVKKFRQNKDLTELDFLELKKNHFFSIKKIFKNFLSSVCNILGLNNNILISNVGLNLTNTLKIYWYLKKVSFIEFDNLLKQENFTLHMKFRNEYYKNFQSKNNFELFLIKNLMRYIPLNYLEHFEQMNKIIKDRNISAKFLITAYDHVTNDYVKVFYAQNYKKIKFCSIRHGTSFLNLNYNIQNFEKEISYKYLVQNPSSPKESFLPHHLSLMKNNKELIKNKICIIFYEPKEFDHFRDGPIYKDNLKIINSVNKIIENLYNIFKKDLVIVSNRSKNFRYTKKLKKKFKDNLIDEPLVFNKYLNKSKLFIATMPYSTYLQAFLKGPTILFLNKRLWVHSKKFNLIKKEMIKNKLIFEDEVKMSKHIFNVSKNPDEWWDSKNVLKVRKKFKKLFGIEYSTAKEFSFYLKKLK